jgi:hypothetical protein
MNKFLTMNKFSHKKFLILFSLFLLLGIFGWAKHSWAVCPMGHECVKDGTTWTCPDADYQCINPVMSGSNFLEGDTIYISGTINPNGTWPSTLTVTKGCWIKGAGRDVITLTSTQSSGPEVSMILYDPGAASITNNTMFKVTGLTLNGGDNNGTLGGGGISINGPTTTAITKILIGDNRFVKLSNVTRASASAYGVIYGNIFLNVVEPFRSERLDATTWNTFVKIDWTKDGTANSDCRTVRSDLSSDTSCFMYFEDNYVYWTNNYGTGNAGFQHTGQGNRFAIRYNTDDFTGINKCDRIIDNQCYASNISNYELHDSRPDLNYAPMGAVIYGNLLKNDITDPNPRLYVPLASRGGKMMRFFNYWKDISAHQYPPSVWFRNQFPDNPLNSQQSVQHVNDSYVWKNWYKDHDVSSPTVMDTVQSGDACYGYGFRAYYGACFAGTAVTTGTATGGSTTSVTDTSKDFISAGVNVGDWIVNDACKVENYPERFVGYDQCYPATTGCKITSITNSNHTLNCSSAMTFPTNNGDAYYVVHEGAGMVENREWWTDNNSFTPSSCTSGIGCGSTLPSGSCPTEGVGYWYTTQGNCNNPDGWVGRSEDRTNGLSTKIQGTLYRCTNGTWTAYWTPDTYPHPLRGAIDTTPPAAPTGLAVQ